MRVAARNARRLIWCILVHVVAVIIVALWSRGLDRGHAAAFFLVALLPAIPVVAATWFAGRYFYEEHDAYQLRAAIEAMLWAAGVTFGIATAWGFLEEASRAPRVPSYFAFSVYCIVVGAVRTARHVVGGAALGSVRGA